MARTIGPDDLINDVRHQVEVFVITNACAATPPSQDAPYVDRITHAANGTAHLLALRTLVDFFENDDPDGRNATARMFTTGNPWTRKDGRRSLDELKPIVKDPGGGRFAHIGFIRAQRRRQPAKSAQEVRRLVDNLLVNFYDRLDSQWRHRFYRSLDHASRWIEAAPSEGPPDDVSGDPPGTSVTP